jgi:GntR family transcriptional regulator/MocR family aminotransferase
MASVTSPIFQLPKGSKLPLRDQICEVIGAALSNSALPLDVPLPSCRDLAEQLRVSRNTVHSAYTRLVDLGLIYARDRSGYYGSKEAGQIRPRDAVSKDRAIVPDHPLSVTAPKPSELRRVRHPRDWSSYRYPFIYNQIEPGLFPIDAWRECSRQALSRRTLDEWTSDSVEGDSAHLLKQLRQRLLTYRGIYVNDDEIMVTLGAQNALSIIGLLMRRQAGVIAVEDPGYPDARNAFSIAGNDLAAIDVDDEGLLASQLPPGCKLVYVTPSHQFPTSVTMSIRRRHELVRAATEGGYLILEDDYEANLSSAGSSLPSLRSIDGAGRVIYIGSFSKTLSPGLRLGFMVAHRDIIREARAIRGYLVRHAPTLIQETTALFLGLGYHDAHLRKVERRRRDGWNRMHDAIDRHLGAFQTKQAAGGTSFWLTGPAHFDASALSDALLKKGAIIDKGQIFYLRNDVRNTFRLGFAYIDVERIEAGIRLIAKEAKRLLA